MFELIIEYNGFVWVRSKDEFAILPARTLRRARRRFIKRVKLRKPSVKTISGEKFLFTTTEWDWATEFAIEFQVRCDRCAWRKVYHDEKNRRHNIQILRQKIYEIKARNIDYIFRKISKP